MHFLKQELRSLGPDPRLSGTLGPKMSAQSHQIRVKYFIHPLPFAHNVQEHAVRRSLSTTQTVSGPDVISSDMAQGAELCPLVLFESWMWPTETVCLLEQAEGTQGLYCDRRKAVHCPVLCPGW